MYGNCDFLYLSEEDIPTRLGLFISLKFVKSQNHPSLYIMKKKFPLKVHFQKKGPRAQKDF